MNHYITLSLETHLFFARIMKEHALFLTAGFVCKDKSWIQKSDWYRMQFETLLSDAVQLANGRVRNNILQSDELVTVFTIQAEKQTENLSGIQINTVLTKQEKMLRCGCSKESDDDLACKIQQMNYQSLRLLDGLIDFKESVLCEVSNCKLFTANYPLLIKHIIREAKLYRSTIEALMRDKNICNQSLMQIETFWNQIMMEHALFIRGLLDPSEEQLIDTADGFADDYKKLFCTIITFFLFYMPVQTFIKVCHYCRLSLYFRINSGSFYIVFHKLHLVHHIFDFLFGIRNFV